MNLTLQEIAEHIEGGLHGRGKGDVRGYSIDSRTLKRGELFFAIKGKKFDGHQYIGQAAERGASGVVVSDPGAIKGDLAYIHVDSTLDALHSLASAVRRLWGRPIIAVTGSVGKTTTKEMIAAVLGERFSVLRSIGNMNNQYGLPLSLLQIEKHHEFAVLEMGMSTKGEIAKLASITEPTEGLVTNVNPVHMEFFESLDGIAREKAQLLEGLVGTRRAYLNYSDRRVRSMARKFDGEIVTFGIRSAAAFRVTCIESLGLHGVGFTLRHGRRNINFILPLMGDHNVLNATAAISVAVTHGLSWEQIRSALEGMAPSRMRGEIIHFREGITVIDDSYNSNPKALIEMIRLLGKTKGFSRKILVAGEMRELGKKSATLHAACGREAVKSGIDLMIGVSGDAQALIDGAAEAGAERSQLYFFKDVVDAGDFLVEKVKEGDLLLLKGSRGILLEQVLDTLRLSFSSLEP